MDNIVYLVEITVPTVTNDVAGYGTPLTAETGSSLPVYGEKVLKFTDSMGGDLINGYHKCIDSVNITLPKLKVFSGVAGLATLNISFVDFIGDPDLESIAVQNEPSIKQRGTYFGKAAARHILNNKKVVVREYDAKTDTYLRVFTFKIADFNAVSTGKWTLQGKDELTNLTDDTAVFPNPFSGRVLNTPGTGGTTVEVEGDYTEWQGDYALQVGNELMTISSVSGDGASAIISVGSRLDFRLPTGLGDRLYKKTVESIDTNSVANRVAAYVESTISYIIASILDQFNVNYDTDPTTGLVASIDEWAGTNTYGCVFVGEESAMDILNNICELFLINIYADTLDGGLVKADAASSWKDSEVVLEEGKQITYAKGSVKFSNAIRYSRVQVKYNQYDPFDDSTYLSEDTKYNSEYESDEYYGEQKLKELPKSPVLGPFSSDRETANINSIRFLNRWSLKPKEYTVEIRWKDAQTLQVGDVVTLIKEQIQRVDGAVNDQERAQIIGITAKSGGVNTITCVTYEPYEANTDNHIFINKDKDVNLFVEAGAPPKGLQNSEYTFVMGSAGSAKYGIRNIVGSMNQVASIVSGAGWKCPVILNLVLLDGFTITAKGGNGGLGLKGGTNTVTQENTDGGNGGTCVYVNSPGLRLIIWFKDTRTVQGVEYECDGYVYAPGGGGAAGKGLTIQGIDQETTYLNLGGNGGGGVGYPVGLSTPGATPPRILIPSKTAPISTVGIGEVSVFEDFTDAANGGDFGLDGETLGVSNTLPGEAGKAFIHGVGQIVINTNITNGRILKGNGDSPYNPNTNPPPAQSCPF